MLPCILRTRLWMTHNQIQRRPLRAFIGLAVCRRKLPSQAKP